MEYESHHPPSQNKYYICVPNILWYIKANHKNKEKKFYQQQHIHCDHGKKLLKTNVELVN